MRIAAAVALPVFTLLLLAAMPAGAQVFAPVTSRSELAGGPANMVTVQASEFQYASIGSDAQLGVLGAADFAVAKHFGVGGWLSTDRQTTSGGSTSLFWYEGHGSYIFTHSTNSAIGVTAGFLGTHITGGGISNDVQWGEYGLVGSLGIGGTREKPARLWLGADIGGLAGISTAKSGFSYGASVEYRLTRAFSVNASTWNMDLDGNTISRYNAGVGYHF